MLTRSKQFYRREKTADDPVRENEKYSLRVLEECKRKIASDAEIPKNDRLELRKHIRNGCSLILELFRKHRANPNLNSLQVGLRKYVAKCKLTLQNELIESFKSSALNSPRMRNAGIKIIESEAGVKNRVSKSLENGQQVSSIRKLKTVKTPLKELDQLENFGGTAEGNHPEHQELSQLEKENISRLLGRPESSTFLSKTLIGSASSCQLAGSQLVEAQEIFEDKYRTQPPATQLCTSQYPPESLCPRGFTTQLQPSSGIFTDPRLMEECRQILSRVHIPQPNWGAYTTNYAFAIPTDLSAASVLLDPRSVFGGRQAETVMDEFFQPETELPKESFVYRMKEYIRKHIPSNNYAKQSIENYFDVLSANGRTLSISRFGKELDQYCMKRIPMHPVRKQFSELDPNNFGYLGRNAVEDGRWETLFRRADSAGRGIIEYWDLFGVRKSWQYISFSIWQQQLRLL